MRHSAIVLAVAFAAACKDPKYPCTTDLNCPTGTSCDVGKKLCVIVGGCTTICKSNETCHNAQCTALTCSLCNADASRNTPTFTCAISPVVSGVTAPSTWSPRTPRSP